MSSRFHVWHVYKQKPCLQGNQFLTLRMRLCLGGMVSKFGHEMGKINKNKATNEYKCWILPKIIGRVQNLDLPSTLSSLINRTHQEIQPTNMLHPKQFKLRVQQAHCSWTVYSAPLQNTEMMIGLLMYDHLYIDWVHLLLRDF